jgi:hypothetical protein
MKLDNPITVISPPSSDSSGKIIESKSITLDYLKIIYVDDVERKSYFARIEQFPTPVYLYNGEEYDKLGPFNKVIGEHKLKTILGSDPQTKLRGLFPKTLEEDPNGPGTILSQMIKSVGIVMTQGCSCRRHALEMNSKGNDWCEANIDTVVGWLRDEAKKRKLPFIDTVGKMIVNRAIKKSRKLLANEPVPENDEDLDNQ